MRAAQLVGPQSFEVVDVARPAPEEGECLIRLEIVSVCGSDVRSGFRPSFAPEQYPLPVGYPGHECAGIVVESRAEGIKEGQRVIVHPHGLTGLVEYLVADPTRFAVVPDDGDLATWLMAEPPATVLHACRKLGPVFGKRVLVLGQGMLGQCWTHFMSKLGADEIVVADLEDSRLERASKLGATRIFNPRRESVDAIAEEMTGGDGFDVVVEAAGELETVRIAPHLTRLGGTVVFFGTTDEDFVVVDFRSMRKHELTTICTAPGRGNDVGQIMTDMLRLVQRGWFDPAPFVTHRWPFERVEEAFRTYDAREDGVMKIMLSFNGN